jgi:hypothetical protein
MDPHEGVSRLTYDDLTWRASLSRAKVSDGLDVLQHHGIIERHAGGRSLFGFPDYNPNDKWVAFPARGLYHEGRVEAFVEFRLRRRAELDALKLYYLFALKRDADTNIARIGYDKIEEQSGVPRGQIRRALTVLGANGLVHVERLPSDVSDYGVSNGYRLTHLYPRMHMGTTGRSMTAHDVF